MIYFVSLIAGSAWTWMEHFRDANYRALGASGAISGVTSAAALFFPFADDLSVLRPADAADRLRAGLTSSGLPWRPQAVRATASATRLTLAARSPGVVIVCLLWPEAPQAMIDQLADRLRGF